VVSLEHYLVVSALLFSIGATGVFFHRNLLSIFLCLELMLNAVNLTLVACSRSAGNLEGQALAFLVIVVATAEALVGLGILVAVHRGRASLDVDDQNLLRH
jgi:NADH-quinone oxidoreductase subunit K